jgi:hypothetical protein
MFKRLFTVIRELDKTKTKYKHECMEQQFKYIDIERLQLTLLGLQQKRGHIEVCRLCAHYR